MEKQSKISVLFEINKKFLNQQTENLTNQQRSENEFRYGRKTFIKFEFKNTDDFL